MNHLPLHALTVRLALGLGITLASTAALAANHTVHWLAMSPTPFGSAPPLAGNHASGVTGVGPVTMTYSAASGFGDARLAHPLLSNGSVSFNQDTYSWGAQELLARSYLNQTLPSSGNGSGLNQAWDVTYQFSQPMAAGTQLVVGVMGLGRRMPDAPGETLADTTTTATISFGAGPYINLGDYNNSNDWGQTLVTVPGPGHLRLVNSQNGFGGIDPWWNTGLNLTVFSNPQAMSSLTVRFDQTLGDGVGVNIGFISSVPEPGQWALFAAGLAALGVMRQRRARG